MQIERLYYFLEIAKAGSIKKASESIHISQQALSQSMMAMEKELGVTLFNRGRRGIVLTDAGKKLKPIAQDICDRWAEFTDQLNEKPVIKERLCIGIAPYLEMNYYAEILNHMKRTYPDCKLDVSNVYPAEAAKFLHERTMDLAIVSIKEDEKEQLLAEHDDLQMILLRDIEVDVLVNRHSDLAQLSKLTFEQMAHYQVAVEKYNDYELEFFLGKELAERKLNMISVRSVHTAQEMVAKNLAVSFAAKTDSIFKEYRDKIVKIDLDCGKKLGVMGILVHNDDVEDEVIQSLLELLCTSK